MLRSHVAASGLRLRASNLRGASGRGHPDGCGVFSLADDESGRAGTSGHRQLAANSAAGYRRVLRLDISLSPASDTGCCISRSRLAAPGLGECASPLRSTRRGLSRSPPRLMMSWVAPRGQVAGRWRRRRRVRVRGRALYVSFPRSCLGFEAARVQPTRDSGPRSSRGPRGVRVG